MMDEPFCKIMLLPACKVRVPLVWWVLLLRFQEVPVANVMSLAACNVIAENPAKAVLTFKFNVLGLLPTETVPPLVIPPPVVPRTMLLGSKFKRPAV